MQRTEISHLDDPHVALLAAALGGSATLAGIASPLLAKLVRLGALLEGGLHREARPAEHRGRRRVQY